jgi:NAD(P) transhydrogenase subunit alpha
MIIGVPKETYPGERRVALVPLVVGSLTKAGNTVMMESGAGTAATYPDDEYVAKGARIGTRAEIFQQADIVAQVRTFSANARAGEADLGWIRTGQVVVGFADPLAEPLAAQRIAITGATLFSLELMPRTTRAQSMDALSSMATVAGYKAVLLAANTAPKMFPLMMTAAGTLQPVRVLVLGAGVAGLQAIATARRNGALVEAYDVRPAVKEQVESLGAKFVDLGVVSEKAEGAGGYAQQQSADFLDRQREALGRVIATADVVITTAAVPGQRAPILVTSDMVRQMSTGSVIVDLAAERGGNCELTRPGETVIEGGVTVFGPLNLATDVPTHASQMYAKNIAAFISYLIKDNELRIDHGDEIVAATLVAAGGVLVHPRVLRALQTAEEPGHDRV